MIKQSPVVKIIKKYILFIIAGIILYYISYNNYLLFHNIIELSSVVIGVTIFIITKNTHKVSQNNYFIFLGTCFLLVAGFGFLHILTYGSMNVIQSASSNSSLYLRLIGTLIQASSIFIFSLLIYRENKPIKLKYLLTIYYIFSVLMLILILKWNVFPIPFIEDLGNTTFRWIVEIVIFAALLLSMALLIKDKKKLHENISVFLLFSVIIFILSELCFVFNMSTTDLASVTGHVLRLLSYYLIYKAIIQTTLENPYNVLFYRLTEINSSLEIKTRLLMKINKKLNEEIIERKEIEESLRLSKKKYQELLDFLPSAIITLSEGKIVYLNSIALKLLNLKSYKEALEREILDFVHPGYKTLVNDRVGKVYDNHEEDITEFKMLSSDGRELDVETKAVPYVYNEKPAVLVIIGDISERKKALEKDKALKEAMEYDRIKNEFMANISHELRTPLNVIFGAVQLIEYYSENNSVCENKQNITKYSKSMRQNCYRMLRLVNNLIDLTRLDSGFLKLNLQNHNIINIIEDITLSVAQYIESKNINIEFDTEVEEKYLACDADMIERIMLNILSNAVKFTPKGGSIWVNVYDRGDFILISIKDSGIGIPEDKLQVIFDRFRQVDKTLTRNTEGSGIGLNLVKSLVELHEGEICAESKCGQGSEFIVELPVRTVPWDEVAATIDMPQGKVERIHIEFSDIYS